MCRYLIIMGVLLAGLLVGATPASANTVIVLSDQGNKIVPDVHLQVLQDPTKKLTIEQLVQPAHRQRFVPVDADMITASFIIHWLKVSLVNPDERGRKVYFVLKAEHATHLQVYYRSVLGDISQLKPVPEAQSATYPLELPGRGSGTLFVRVDDNKNNMSLAMDILSTEKSLLSLISHNNLIIGLMIGCTLMMALYNFVVLIRLREPSFFFLSVFSFTMGLELLRLSGFLSQIAIFDTDSPGMGSFSTYVLIASVTAFYYFSMEIPRYFPKQAVWLERIFWLAILLSFFSPWLPFRSQIGGALGGFLVLFATPMTLILYRRNVSAAKHLALALMVLVIFTIPIILSALGLFSIEHFLGPFYASIVVFLGVLSLTLVERTREAHQKIKKIESISEARENFLNVMSHEFRAPLNVLVSINQLLQDNPSFPQQEEYLKRMDVASKNLLALAENLLDLSILDKDPDKFVIKAEPFYLDALMHELGKLFSTTAQQKGLDLTVEAPHTPHPMLLGDSERLQQVLVNLLGNAIKYTKKGQVILSYEVLENTGDALRVCFKVSDTGIGIAPHQQQKLFLPFYRIDSRYAREQVGFGLGLSISHQLIKKMGGTLMVESKPEEGSHFFFTLLLPVFSHRRDASVAFPARGANKLQTLQGISILLVDDDEMNRFAATKLLQNRGATVTVAEDGLNAILKVEQQLFDVIFMDISMPGLDGYETTRQLRVRTNGRVPIIALTAHALVEEKERCLAAGMDDYLSKPFQIEDMERLVLQQRFPLFLKIHYNQRIQKLPTVLNRAPKEVSFTRTRLAEVSQNTVHPLTTETGSSDIQSVTGASQERHCLSFA